jgi:hypothetical protein
MTYKREFGAGIGRGGTPNESFACQFLIDTLPIRITSNSFDCSFGVRSNRHSSEPLNVTKVGLTKALKA